MQESAAACDGSFDLKEWVSQVREVERRPHHNYPDFAPAVHRMKEANPFLSDAAAEHLTLHGTNWNADGSMNWKFDPYTRVIAPLGMNRMKPQRFWRASPRQADKKL